MESRDERTNEDELIKMNQDEWTNWLRSDDEIYEDERDEHSWLHDRIYNGVHK